MTDEQLTLADQPEPTETTIVVPSEANLPPQSDKLADLREIAMVAPVEIMRPALEEFAERRQTFGSGFWAR